MTEPILSLTSVKDCLDIMLEMQMFTLLKNPIIVEVLNLVYEGEYSYNSSILSMSKTLSCLFDVKTFSLKSINNRITDNIYSLG